MSIWRRLYRKPSGVIPGSLFTRIGVAALALLCGLLILTHSFTGQGGEEAVQDPAEPAGLAIQRRAGARLAQLADREQQRQALEARQQLQERTMPGALPTPVATNALSLPLGPGENPSPSPPPSEAELQLREQLRLEDLRRRHDSLRSGALGALIP